MQENANDLKLRSDIDEFGLSVIHIPEDDYGPAYSFSVGLFHTYKHPEVIVFGLSQEIMHAIINGIASEIKSGTQYEVGALYDDILSNYNCTFREVTAGWISHYLGYACWYYRNSDFPVIQCIWPDKSQKFHWDNGVAGAISALQPLLFGDVGTDPLVDLKSNWPFRDSKDTSTFTCQPILSKGTTILYVGHDYEDGAWQFLDGSDHPDGEPILVSLGEIASKHPDILQLADLPLGWQAMREAAGTPWVRCMQGDNLDDDQ